MTTLIHNKPAYFYTNVIVNKAAPLQKVHYTSSKDPSNFDPVLYRSRNEAVADRRQLEKQLAKNYGRFWRQQFLISTVKVKAQVISRDLYKMERQLQ